VSGQFNITEVEFEKSATRPQHYPADELPHVAFVGRSNVGKSSLLNMLANRKRLARVSATPGHTQLINFFKVNRAAYFVDLPGYGFARAPKDVQSGWEKMITTYLADNPRLRAVVAIFDVRHDRTAKDRELLEWLRHYCVPFIAAMTKADKLTRSQQADALRRAKQEFEPYAPIAVHLISAQSRQGREEILETIGHALAVSE
jgi:GTP-binding protein